MFNSYSDSLTTHFRSYPEIISYSNETFYKPNEINLVTSRIRTKPIKEVLEFIKVDTKGNAGNNINLDESVELIKKALEYEPTNGAYLDSLGWAYYRKKRFDLALKKLLEAERELARENSPDPVVYDHIGDTYKGEGKIDKAIEYWDKSLKMKRDPAVEKKLNEAKSGHR